MEQRPSDVGARLREARERRGLTLQAVANATKISVAALTAVERNDVAHLPGGLYTRGHVRAYASEVGLNPDELAGQYLAQFGMPPGDAPRVPRGVEFEKRPIQVRAIALAVLVCGIGLLIYGLLVGRSSGIPPEPAGADTAPTASAAEPSASTVPGTGVSPTALATTDRPALLLEVLPRGACWVSVRADGQIVIFRVMRRGERALVEARDTIVLNIGDAGAFAYRINGAPGRPLGRPGEVVTVSIREDTYKTFLAEAAGR